MNKDIKEQWIEALRNEKFKQGNGRLLHDGRHCCLGVLCEVSGCSKYCDEKHQRWIFVYSSQVGTAYLPDQLMKDLELSKHEQDFLVSLNDVHKQNFQEISNWIETNL